VKYGLKNGSFYPPQKAQHCCSRLVWNRNVQSSNPPKK